MRNIEKLRDYFLGKDPQLKETMADNSLRLIGIEGKHFVLRTELLQRLKNLKDELTEVDEDLQNQIDAVVHDLEEEIHDRIEADKLFVKKSGDIMSGALSIGSSNNNILGQNALAQGAQNEAAGANSHAEGLGTTASGIRGAHSEGWGTTASGSNSHAEGHNSTASGGCTHAEGRDTVVSGNNAHGEGLGTITSGAEQHTQGRYNIEDAYTYAQIIGNGANNSNRSNAHTVDWNGNAWYSGDVYVGSTSGTNKDTGSKKLATEDFVTANATFKKLEGDIVIVQANPTIEGIAETGWYDTGDHKIWWGDVGEDVVANENTLFYFHKDEDNDNWIWINPATAEDGGYAVYDSLYYDLSLHQWMYIGYQITDDFNIGEFAEHTVPTTAGVIGYVNEHLPRIELNESDVSTYFDEYEGKLVYISHYTGGMYPNGTDEYNDIYYVGRGTYNEIQLYGLRCHEITGAGSTKNICNYVIRYVSSKWTVYNNYLTTISTEISSSSTNATLPSSKAVYDFVLDTYLPEFDLRYDDSSTKFSDYVKKLVVINKYTNDQEQADYTRKGLYYVVGAGSLINVNTTYNGTVPYNQMFSYDSVTSQWVTGGQALLIPSQTITTASTHAEIPTTKAVYDLVKALADANGLTMP